MPKLNFQKNKAVSGKTPLFFVGPFVILHSVCLKIGFCMEMWRFS